MLIPALPDFLARYPGIRIDLGVSDRSDDIDWRKCRLRHPWRCALENSSLIRAASGRRRDGHLRHAGLPEAIWRAGFIPANSGMATSWWPTSPPRTDAPMPLRFMVDGAKVEIKAEHRIGVNESNGHLAAGLAGLGIIQTFHYCARAAL